ncbi:MAG: hypothetical protein IT518_16710 [Burkholderiales bacterium]|nr:hypothetical protein [Burkholderiales bacterium]
MWGAHWTMELEKRGVPGVFIVDRGFEADTQITCDKEGMPQLRRVLVPHPCGEVSDAELPNILPQLVDALTRPLTEAERSPPPLAIERPGRVAFEGTLAEVNRFFCKRGWSDGLPIIPPTDKAVREMLACTSHAPDEVVTTRMLPESYTVTVEKVAVVGVMAGCEPRALPVLLALVQAFDKDWFSSTIRSTTSLCFSVVVNGPAARRIGMNAGVNALGSGTGNQANATIGRFLRLAIICLGGSRSGVNDMSSIGNPAKYSFAFAENEERSPWEPFHVAQGYQREDSVVTVMTGGWSHSGPFAWLQDDVERGMDSMAEAIAQYELPSGAMFIVDPRSARRIAAKGYSKQAAEAYIRARATRTRAQFQSDHFYVPIIEPVLMGHDWYGKKAVWSPDILKLQPHDRFPVYPEGSIRIIVAGGETNAFAQAWQMSRPSSARVDAWQ